MPHVLVAAVNQLIIIITYQAVSGLFTPNFTPNSLDACIVNWLCQEKYT